MAHFSPLQAPHFAATETPEEISKRLREDEALISAQKPCSWLAYHLPEYETERGSAIAAYLAPSLDLSHDIKKLIYENILNRIRRHLRNSGSNTTPDGTVHEMEMAEHALLPSELSATLKVIAHLQETAVIQRDTTAGTIMAWLEERVAPVRRTNSEFVPNKAEIPRPPPTPRKRLCYICRMAMTNPYPPQSSMCIPCGSFNHSSSLLSTPSRLVLPKTFTALVTGARVNLGYHTALRLLRCGAQVIATTRYPHDAILRYIEEPDSHIWRNRLRVIGADFRSAKDAHNLVLETKQCLKQWANGRDVRLSALINNAAQTLTDSVKKEERAVKRENDLSRRITHQELLIEGSYKSRVRGRELPPRLENATSNSLPTLGFPEGRTDNVDTADTLDLSHETTMQLEPYTKSSWVQSISEIPYEDVGSALSVNTFVPFILCRELLPLMGYSKVNNSTNPPSPPTKPQGYIINVSSREGIFETHTSSSAKRGKHVHTNMSKAALNMLTETEAESAWRGKRVAMNTVDPGYMSAAPEYEDAFEGVRPIGWEDGAGRVLWPIAVAEMGGRVVWGRFLKHYGAVEGEAGRG
ncbi:uncharacterized protein ALTATR162_LOCUS2199 [Alternaria atra]|uniref:NAD(P)-binding protein n=1 Tax=Alternaria atra TaxID=119953 RepID=A0A8J2HXM7_9PLEO|nr:uncharacterized protein ALTATR162_LOCUS2199 [Alternaria atra]CAG5148431.1 unnamed protein product [Alternaria atra]